MQLERIESPGLAHYSYLLSDGGEALVIDPRRDVDAYVDRTSLAGLRLRHVLETHRNEDYLTGSHELGKLTGAAVWHADGQLDYGYGRPAADGPVFSLGSLQVEALATPGHTEGHLCYLVRTADGEPWLLFSGDCIFAGDVGRTDLRGEERIEEMTLRLHESIFGRLLPLGDHVILLPAHGPGSACGSQIADRPWTTIGIERRLNPRLRLEKPEEFLSEVGQALEYPPYFKWMEERYLRGEPFLAEARFPLPMPVEEFHGRSREPSQTHAENAMVLDTRPVTSFAAAHVPRALSLWEDGLGGFAGWFLEEDQALLLVSDGTAPMEAVLTLRRMGFDRVEGYLAGGMHAWHTAGLGSSRTDLLDVPSACRVLDERPRPWMLDVRSSAELDEALIPGAHHIHLPQLPGRTEEVPRDRRVTVFCGSGLRSMAAASLLEREGHQDVEVVMGGVEGWESRNFPLE